MEENKNKKSVAYHIGQAIAVILAACVMAIVIALTAKFIGWIF